MKNVKLLLLMGFVASLAWTSCKKGDTGPAGATGPAGPDSVVYSSWVSLTFSYIPVTDTSGYFEDTVVAPSITQAILDSGLVLSYLDYSANNDGSTIIPMSTASQLGFAEIINVGSIIIEDFSGFDDTGAKYRYVTIPGSKMEGNSTSRKYNGYSIEELKSMSYTKALSVATAN